VHAARLWSHLYLDLADSFSAAVMPDLPAKVRARLEAETHLGIPSVALATDSSDGFTRKYLLRLADGERIETVLMRFTGRVTACVSSQVGCAMGCVFCATGQMGYLRHLTPGEIVAQAVHVARTLRVGDVAGLAEAGSASTTTVADRPGSATPATTDPGAATPAARLRNVVLMGMGEPLHNYDAVMQASTSCAIRAASRSARSASR
jgi:23S rRNA (adenine2503-C2)-methyltransferase